MIIGSTAVQDLILGKVILDKSAPDPFALHLTPPAPSNSIGPRLPNVECRHLSGSG